MFLNWVGYANGVAMSDYKLIQAMARVVQEGGFVSIALGINADSLATWFIEAVRPVLER